MKITWCTTQAILDKCVVSLDCDLCSFNYSLYNFSCHVHDLYMYMFLEGFFFCSVFLQATDFFTFPIYICIYNISFKGKVQISCPDKKKKRQMIPVPNTSTEYYNICFLIAATLENFIVLCIH